MDGFWEMKCIQGEHQCQGFHESHMKALSKTIPTSGICFKSGNVMVPFDMKMYGKLNFIDLIFKKLCDRLIF